MVWRFVVSLVRKRYFRRLRGPFRHDGGHCWTALLPELCHLADTASAGASTLVVYENGVRLLHGHSEHALIRDHGAGRYSHWERGVFFAASDNSDPNSNGRTYTYSTAPHLHKLVDPVAGFVPMNFRQPDTCAEAIAGDVEHAFNTGRDILVNWLGGAAQVRGKRVLEIGPGIHFGTILFLAAHGAVPVVADRFLATWSPEYHPPFYRSLRARIASAYPELDVRPLSAVIEAGDYPADVLQREPHGLEGLTLADCTIDVSYSNAVLEHLDDFAKAFRQLQRVTRPGGWGVHQGDFRFHESFDRPLEHLLMSAEEFEAHALRRLRGCGTQRRPYELAALFAKCGFDPVCSDVDLSADPAYFADFVPRLRRAEHSPYYRASEENLRPLGVLFRVRKPEQSPAAKPLLGTARRARRWLQKKIGWNTR